MTVKKHEKGAPPREDARFLSKLPAGRKDKYICPAAAADDFSKNKRKGIGPHEDRCILARFIVQWTCSADVAKLADAPDLGSGGQPCRFKSCHPHQKTGRVCALLLCGGAFAPFYFAGARLRPFTLRGRTIAPFYFAGRVCAFFTAPPNFFAQSRPKNFLAQIRPIFCGLRNNRNFCRLRNNRIFLARKRAGQDVRLSFY